MAIVAIAPGMFLAQSIVPSSGSTAMSTFGPILGADLLADEQHRRLVDLPLADHHGAVDRQLVELAPHGIDRGLIGGLVLAVTAQARRGDRRTLGHTHDFEAENALQHQFRLDGNARHYALPSQTRFSDAGRTQFFSIRITCGRPEITLSRPTAARALRTASSLVA